MNKKRLLNIFFILMIFLIIMFIDPSQIFLVKAQAAIKLTTTEQETDYVLTIGSKSYNINTIDTLIDANLALLEWEAKGSSTTTSISGTFDGVTYTTFSKIYSQIYSLLISSATKSFADGSNLSTNTAISKNAIWKISGTVSTQSGYVTCPSGKKLIIVANGKATLKYAAIDTRINVGREDATDAGVISFQGKTKTNCLTIEGMGNTEQEGYAPILLKSGKLYVNYVTIKSFSVAGEGLISLFPGHDAARYMYMSHSTISSIRSKSSGAIYCRAYYTEGSNVENLKSKIYLYDNTFTGNTVVNNNSAGTNMGNTNGGAAIRSYAADNTSLRAEKCTFTTNKAGTGTEAKHVKGSGGGAIYWKSVSNKSSIINCTFTDNSTTSVGGAIYNTGNMEIKKSTFENNHANYGGGAIAAEPPVTSNLYENIDVENLSGSLTLDKNTSVSNNSAGIYGGGIFFNALEGKIKNTITTYEMELIINGTNISNNTSSSYGGGIAMLLDYLELEYKTGVIINENSVINNNSAVDAGGAIWMGNTETCICNLNQGVKMNGGTIDGNQSKTGGFLCIDSKSIDTPMNFYMNDGLVKNNTVTNNGGAVNIFNGNFEMLNGELINNTAENNGGAVYVDGGDFSVSGESIIKECVADYGGAVYVSGGNVNITGGTIKASEAISGGGICISNGNIKMNGGIISDNQAEKYGGGIYASSDSTNLDVQILSGSIIRNIANIDGGGIGVNMDGDFIGTVTVGLENCSGIDNNHSHPVIKENTANHNGGGFWLNGDNMIMNMYCGSIINNVAVLEPGSANIYQTGGQATVYFGEVGEGVIVIGGKYDYVPDNDIPEVYITYNSNIPNNVETKKAEVTVGVEIFLPKNLYIRESYTLLGWSYVKEPTEEDVVFGAGEAYLVPNEDITVYAVWKMIGAGEIESPVIIPGKHYDEITGKSNILISSDASFTAQMVVNEIEPNLYKNRTLSFDRYLPYGTKILMVDMTNSDERLFYKYNVLNETTNSILLSEFINLKGESIGTTYSNLVNEAFLFVIEFPRDNNILGPTQVKLTRYSDNEDLADIEQIVSYTTTEQRSFDLESDLYENLTINDIFNLKYNANNPSGEDVRYLNKKMALVIENKNEAFLEDVEILNAENSYILKSDNRVIIPLNGVKDSFDLDLNLLSKYFLKNEKSCKLNAELWITSNTDADRPFMGNMVDSFEINLSPIYNVAFDIETDRRVKYVDEIGDNISLSYETLNLDSNYDVILSVQRKNDEGIYETSPSLVQSVSAGTDLGEGKYKLELSESGKIKITFLDNLILEKGTYRVYIEIFKDDEVVLEVPYSFILLEKDA